MSLVIDVLANRAATASPGDAFSAKDTGQDFVWTTQWDEVPSTIVARQWYSAKGMILAGSAASAPTGLAVAGTTGYVLSVDPAEVTGLKWIPSAGGSDPWTYKTLATAFTTTSATAQAVTGLSFTPTANTKYDIYGMFYVKTAVTATVPRVGLAWPTGLNTGVATLYITAGASTQYLVNLNSASSGLTAVGAIASTAFWPAQMNAVIDVGASPSGSIVIQFCCEAANTAVVMGSGSFLKYRSYT